MEASGEEQLINVNSIMTTVYLCIFVVVFGISKLVRTQIKLFYLIINEL